MSRRPGAWTCIPAFLLVMLLASSCERAGAATLQRTAPPATAPALVPAPAAPAARPALPPIEPLRRRTGLGVGTGRRHHGADFIQRMGSV